MKNDDLKMVTAECIMNLPKCRYLKYIGGMSGMGVPVRAVHYIEDFGYLDSVKKHTLVITAGLQHRSEPEIEHFFEMLHLKESAGIIVYRTREGILPHSERLLQLAEHFSVPVFSMPHEIPLSDITETITEELFQSRKMKKSMEAFLLSLMSGEFKTGEDAFVCAYISGYLKKESFVCAIIKFDSLLDDFDYEHFKNETDKLICGTANKFFRNIPYIFSHGEVVMMIPLFNDEGYEFADKIVLDITLDFYKNNLSGLASLGVSKHHRDLMEFKEAFVYAKRISDLAFFLNKKRLTPQEKGIFSMFMEVKETKTLENMFNSVLGPLAEYDRANQTALLDTLFSFVEENFNTSATSAALFIHSNTLRYRLDKIQDILQIKLRDPMSVYYVNLAVMVFKYLDFLRSEKKETNTV